MQQIAYNKESFIDAIRRGWHSIRMVNHMQGLASAERMIMMQLEQAPVSTRSRLRGKRVAYLPKVRASILDAGLEAEPELDICMCKEQLVLFVEHHPVAMIAGTALEFMGISGRLHQLRHRYPRKK